ncbi:hypothetical protein, partial [Aquiflexum sp.]|uniref:hypothetical protein n=1 Tax=Aquiflexum sp. TaxID=1872584 RepID=UPI0035944F94
FENREARSERLESNPAPIIGETRTKKFVRNEARNNKKQCMSRVPLTNLEIDNIELKIPFNSNI